MPHVMTDCVACGEPQIGLTNCEFGCDEGFCDDGRGHSCWYTRTKQCAACKRTGCAEHIDGLYCFECKDSERMKIKCAAIQAKSGQVFEGRSHAAIYLELQRDGRPKDFVVGAKQGFVTDTGEFVDRYRAAEIAHKAGQTKKLESPLFSEDLTGDWPWQKKNGGGEQT